MNPYRGEAPRALACPRCEETLPPTDVAECAHGCGTWVSQFASTEVLTEQDRRPDLVTRWWRVRAPCPLCGEQMTLRGDDPGLLQGCDLHGYFIDADTIGRTGLARGVDQAALVRKRSDTARTETEEAELLAAHEEETRKKAAIERREAELGIVRSRMPPPRPAVTKRRKPSDTLDDAHGAAGDADPSDAADDVLDEEGAIDLVEYIGQLEQRIVQLEARVAELEKSR